MKKELIYFIFFLLPASYSCLDTPDMTGGIANMREEPTVRSKTDTIFSNENFTLTIKGEVLTQGKNSSFFDYGFYWGTDAANLTNSFFFKRNDNVKIDTFSYELKNLDGRLTYYWRAVAINQYGTALGEIRSYETPSEFPSVRTEGNSDFPAEGSLLFTGKVLAYGKINSVFVKGFCWGTDPNKLTDSVFIENNSFEPDTFSYILPNARGNTTYYWQAFARNDYGPSYGDRKTYETPPVFKTEGDFTGRTRSYFTVFTLKNTLYLSCGYANNTLYADIWRYDNKWWNDIYDIPGSARRNAVAFTLSDSLAYVGTGQNIERTSLGDFYIFNGNTKTWSRMPDPPAGMQRYEAVAFSLNNKGYVVGGYDKEVLNDVWEYSIKNDAGSWEKMNNFPKPFSGGLCLYNKERVFAGFGNNSETKNILWEYDATNDQWHEFAESPVYTEGERAVLRWGVIIYDRIYLLDVANTIWELDLTTKKYKQKSKLPSNFPPNNEQCMFSLGNVIYIGLGGTELFYSYYPFWDN